MNTNLNVMPLKGINTLDISSIKANANRQERIREYWKRENAGALKKAFWLISDAFKK